MSTTNACHFDGERGCPYGGDQRPDCGCLPSPPPVDVLPPGKVGDVDD